MGNPRDYAAPGNQDPATPWPDSLVLASAIAAATTRLRVALAAVIYPLRHPLLLAKQLATLDLLSEGRLVVQPTVSWHEQEYEALGVPFRRRGAILDEQLEAMASAWRDTPAAYAGKHFRFSDVYLEPKPFRPEGPRMWFGGQSLHPALLRRLVRYGHGFHPFGSPTPEELERLRAALAEAGRELGELEMVGGIRGTFADETSVADLAQAAEAIPGQLAAGLHLDLLQAVDVHRRHRRKSGRSAASSWPASLRSDRRAPNARPRATRSRSYGFSSATRGLTPAARGLTPAARGLTPAARGLTPAARGLTPGGAGASRSGLRAYLSRAGAPSRARPRARRWRGGTASSAGLPRRSRTCGRARSQGHSSGRPRGRACGAPGHAPTRWPPTSSSDPTPRPRQAASTSIPTSPAPKRPTSTLTVPTMRPPASATSEASALRANCLARSSMSTGGSVPIRSRSSATAANKRAMAGASSGRAPLITNSAIDRRGRAYAGPGTSSTLAAARSTAARSCASSARGPLRWLSGATPLKSVSLRCPLICSTTARPQYGT